MKKIIVLLLILFTSTSCFAAERRPLVFLSSPRAEEMPIGDTLSGDFITINSIGDIHINWGVGPGQVSAVDVPIVDVDGHFADNNVEFGIDQNADDIVTLQAGDLRNVAWTDYGGTSTIVGWAATPTANIWYKKVGNLVFVIFNINGTSNATNATFTLPYTTVNSAGARMYGSTRFTDNGAGSTTPGLSYMEVNTSTVHLFTDWVTGTWTNINGKVIRGQFWYEAAP